MPRAAAAHLSHSPTVACSAVDFEWQPLLVQIEKLGADGSSDEQAIAMLTQWVDRAVQALATAPTPTSPPRTSASGRPEPERPAHTASKNLASKIEEALAAIDARSSRAGSGSSDDGSVFAMTVEEELHSQWCTGVTRSLHLFEDKMTLLERAVSAEDRMEALLQHRAYPAAASSHVDNLEIWGSAEDNSQLQQALASSLSAQGSREDEELQLALALSASAAAPSVPHTAPAGAVAVAAPIVIHATAVHVVNASDEAASWFARCCGALSRGLLCSRNRQPQVGRGLVENLDEERSRLASRLASSSSLASSGSLNASLLDGAAK